MLERGERETAPAVARTSRRVIMADIIYSRVAGRGSRSGVVAFGRADLKTMDGGYLEAEMMAKAGADFVVVMGRAHEATLRRVIEAGRDFNVRVMGDNLGADNRVECAQWMEKLGVDVIVHHIGFDE